MSFRLIVFEIAFGIAVGVVEFHSIGTIDGAERNDENLLRICVHHSAVDNAAHTIINGDVDVADALVEADVNVIVTGTGYNGVGANAEHQ